MTKRPRTPNARRGTCQLIGPGSNALRAEASDWVGHRTVPIDTRPVPQLKYGRATDRPWGVLTSWKKVFRIGTVRYNWPMSAHASQAFSTAHCTDSEDLPSWRTDGYRSIMSVDFNVTFAFSSFAFYTHFRIIWLSHFIHVHFRTFALYNFSGTRSLFYRERTCNNWKLSTAIITDGCNTGWLLLVVAVARARQR